MRDTPACRKHVGASHADGKAGPASQPNALRIVIHPFHSPDKGVDVTQVLVDAVAQVLWKLQGGNEPVNQLEARVLLERAMTGRGSACDEEKAT